MKLKKNEECACQVNPYAHLITIREDDIGLITRHEKLECRCECHLKEVPIDE